MTIDLKKLRELASKATPGPWRRSSAKKTVRIKAQTEPYAIIICDKTALGQEEANCDYLSAISPDVLLALLDDLEAARACNAQNIAELHRVDALLGEARAEVKRAHVAGLREALRHVSASKDVDDALNFIRMRTSELEAESERGAP